MSDAALARKFHVLAEWGWPQCNASAFLALAWSLDELTDAGEFVRAAAPHP
jgi:hypothetical protein